MTCVSKSLITWIHVSPPWMNKLKKFRIILWNFNSRGEQSFLLNFCFKFLNNFCSLYALLILPFCLFDETNRGRSWFCNVFINCFYYCFEHCCYEPSNWFNFEILELLKTFTQNFNRLFLQNKRLFICFCTCVCWLVSHLIWLMFLFGNHLVGTSLWCLIDWNRLPCVSMFVHECRLNIF